MVSLNRSWVSMAFVAVLSVVALSGCFGEEKTVQCDAADLACQGIEPPVNVPLNLTFAKEVLIDGAHRGGEPSVAVDSKNHYYVSAPSGFVSTIFNSAIDPTLLPSQGPQNRQSFLWKSEDEGKTWKMVSLLPDLLPPFRGDATVGGADTDVVVDSCDTVYFTDLWLGNVAVSHSEDGGKTWVGTMVTGLLPILDRQWLATDGCGTVYLAYQTFYDQVWVLKSTDKGLTWGQQTLVVDCNQGQPCYSIDGPIIVDPKTHNVYLVMGGAGGKGTQVAISKDGGKTFTRVKSSQTTGNINNIFPVIANDATGNLYVAWSERKGGSYNVYLVRSNDQGAHWSEPVSVSGDEATGTEVFPWVAAGAEGKVAVGWLGANETKETTDDVEGDWFVYLAASDNAHQDNSTWTTVKATQDPMHKGEICTHGLGCTLPQPLGTRGNRNLADFFEITIDRKGHVVAAFPNDYRTADQFISLPYFVKQEAGFLFTNATAEGPKIA